MVKNNLLFYPQQKNSLYGKHFYHLNKWKRLNFPSREKNLSLATKRCIRKVRANALSRPETSFSWGYRRKFTPSCYWITTKTPLWKFFNRSELCFGSVPEDTLLNTMLWPQGYQPTFLTTCSVSVNSKIQSLILIGAILLNSSWKYFVGQDALALRCAGAYFLTCYLWLATS